MINENSNMGFGVPLLDEDESDVIISNNQDKTLNPSETPNHISSWRRRDGSTHPLLGQGHQRFWQSLYEHCRGGRTLAGEGFNWSRSHHVKAYRAVVATVAAGSSLLRLPKTLKAEQ